MNKEEEADLFKMIVELREVPQLYRPSLFWEKLNKKHLQYLSNDSINNFKRTINAKYFNWGGLGILVHQLGPVLSNFINGNFTPLLNSKNNRAFEGNIIEAFIYRIYLAYLYDYISKKDPLKILKKLNEPSLGKPYLVKYRGELISQDLCNSIYDFYSIFNLIKLPKKVKIAELGAGYGRVGYVILKVLSQSQYCVIDIPPALMISQSYLSKIFPKEKIFKFRVFKSFQEVKKEFNQSRIQFIMPHQIELLPSKYFDLFINISSLHEMTRRQIENYIKQIDRLCKGYFYTKQWRKSRTEDNQFIKEKEYPIPNNWKIIRRRERHPIQGMFFDAFYKINPSK